MIDIKQLVENKETLDYAALCKALIEKFGVQEAVTWNSILPQPQQQELFGGEVLRLVASHPDFKGQKDIRPIALKKGSISQMLFFFVRLEDEIVPKKQIELITKRFIKGGDANRFIIWFFGNKSGSELKVVLSGKDGKKVVLKTLPFGVNQPYYKTYDYILTEVQKKVTGLFIEPTELWKALWDALNISIVNKYFFLEIKEAFDSLRVIELSKANQLFQDDNSKVQFSIRLIGRIIFCWFLKRKGIIDSVVLSSEAIKQYDSNYYHDFLEVLFFDVFNTPKGKAREGKNIPNSIANYPFLNGGLFEAQDADFKGNFQLLISNEWFGKFFENTLEKYNFTVDENSSSNAEIAIDPEMLGRIFENLLAEQNTETKILASDRKSTGSFYTPREIVDFMVETSILEYLQNFFPQDLHSDIQDFIHEANLPDSLKSKEKEILTKLEQVKVIDPACGSGAYPMGILQKLVQLKSSLNDKKTHYQLKLETIENSIFGLDKQPMATELSRLRCWLSLVVDEDLSKVKPLPNLDFKFITANSVIDLGYDTFLKKANKEGAMFLKPFLDKVEELKKIRSNFFEVSPVDQQKETLKKEFKKIQKQLYTITLDLAKTYTTIVEFADKLLNWNPFDDSKVAPFFSKSWMFGVEDGFDIVIGNPPYIKEYTNKDVFEGVKGSDYYQGKMDLWYLFACRFLDNLKTNTGILTFIATNNWVTNSGSSKLRNKVVQDAQLVLLIDFSNYKIFESADIQTMIMVLKRNTTNKEYKFDFRKILEKDVKIDDVTAILNKEPLAKFSYLSPLLVRGDFLNKSLVFSTSKAEKILDHIFDRKNFGIDGDNEIMSGIDVLQDVLSKDSVKKLNNKFNVNAGVFVLTDKEVDTLNLSNEELKLLKPYYTTENLSRYYGNKNNKYWIIYTDSSFKDESRMKAYPNIKKHLDKFKDIFTSDNRPYGLHRAREEYFFKGEKILSLRKCSAPTTKIGLSTG